MLLVISMKLRPMWRSLPRKGGEGGRGWWVAGSWSQKWITQSNAWLNASQQCVCARETEREKATQYVQLACMTNKRNNNNKSKGGGKAEVKRSAQPKKKRKKKRKTQRERGRDMANQGNQTWSWCRPQTQDEKLFPLLLFQNPTPYPTPTPSQTTHNTELKWLLLSLIPRTILCST